MQERIEFDKFDEFSGSGEYDALEITALTDHVLWKEMQVKCCLDRNYITQQKDLDILHIGGSRYVKKTSIKDPLIRLESENCTSLDGLFPLSELAEITGLSNYKEKKIRKSEYSVLFYGKYLFKIPQEFYDGKRVKQNMLIHSLLIDDDDDGYEITVNIGSELKIAGYTL